MLLYVKPRSENNKKYSLDLLGFITRVNEIINLYIKEYDDFKNGVARIVSIINNATKLWVIYNSLADEESKMSHKSRTIQQYDNEKLTSCIEALIAEIRPVIVSGGESCGINKWAWYIKGIAEVENNKSGHKMLIDIYHEARFILESVRLNNVVMPKDELLHNTEKSTSHLPLPKAWR